MLSVVESVFVGAVIVAVWHGITRFFFPTGNKCAPRRDKCLACLSPEAAQPEAAEKLPHQQDSHPGGGDHGPSGGGLRGV